MKTKETEPKKLRKLTDEELEQVTGGGIGAAETFFAEMGCSFHRCPDPGQHVDPKTCKCVD